jgi:hypothetical protein
VKRKLELTHSQWMALCSLIAQHLTCPNAAEEFIDCSSPDETVTRPEELLALAMDAPLSGLPPEPPPNVRVKKGG